MSTSINREHWSSSSSFALAAIGGAVGLANLWRFPYTAGTSGGGAFVLTYIAALLLLALPVLVAEMLIGRRGQASPPKALASLAKEAGASVHWRILGFAGVGTAIVVLSFYSVVGGLTLAYSVQSAAGLLDTSSLAAVQAIYSDIVSDPVALTGWFTVFLGGTIAISMRGITNGIERATGILLPILFVMLVGMTIYAAVVGDFGAAARFLFVPDFSLVTGAMILEAFGQAFFTLGVGMTAMIAYGAYMTPKMSIQRTALIVVSADTIVALLAGLAIFPILFAVGADPSGGPGLAFISLPLTFADMPGGRLFGTVFFLLLFFAAITSAVSILEITASWVADKTRWPRKKVAVTSGCFSWFLGLLSVLSFNIFADIRPLDFIPAVSDKNFFDLFDYIASNVMMPLGGACIAIFTGWVLSAKTVSTEMGVTGQVLWFRAWRFLLRYFVPVVMLALFIAK